MNAATLGVLLLLAAPGLEAGAAECADLSGVWRLADVNPSAQYIAGVTPGKMHRYSIEKTGAASYAVRCKSGACMGTKGSVLDVVMAGGALNGTVTLAGTAPDDDAQSPGKCTSLSGVDWRLDRPTGEHYQMHEAGRTRDEYAFSVACKKGPGSLCTSWQSSHRQLRKLD